MSEDDTATISGGGDWDETCITLAIHQHREATGRMPKKIVWPGVATLEAASGGDPGDDQLYTYVWMSDDCQERLEAALGPRRGGQTWAPKIHHVVPGNQR